MTLKARSTSLARRILSRAPIALVVLAFAVVTAMAQDYDVKKYVVDVRIEPAAHAATVRATFALWNPTSAPKRTVQFRIAPKAEIRSVSVAGQQAQFDVVEDKRYTNLKIVRVTLPTPVAGTSTSDIAVDYRFVADGSTEGATISPGESALLPSSHWFPLVNTEYFQYGVNTAPVALTASVGEGEKAVAGGTLTGATFTQPLYDLPFLVAGDFEAPVSGTGSGVTLEVWLPAGAGPQMRAGAERVLAEASKVLAFYSQTLGPPPASTFRIVTSDRAAGYVSPSVAVFGRRVFARETTDAETFELLADGLARIWTEGGAATRGAVPGSAADQPRGVALVRDALPRYLAMVAIGNRYGADAERHAFERVRTALAQMGQAGLGTPLSVLNPVLPNYRGVITTRGPLTIRIVEREVGRERFLAALRETLAAARASGALTAAALRSAASRAAERSLEAVFATWLDQASAPDLIVGLPQQAGAVWTSALRNLGTGDVTVEVVATTSSGKRLASRAAVPSEGFGQVQFETSETIASVEVDPEHTLFESDYSNNARPPRPSPVQQFNEAAGMVLRKEFAAAEAKFRALLADGGGDAVAQAWLARALLGQGKSAEAEKAASAVLAAEPVPAAALGWAHVILGQIAQSAGRHAEAAALFRKAASESADTPALIAARQGLVDAERAAGQAPPVDESVRKYFASFDAAVSGGVNTAQAEEFIDSAALPGFVRGLVTSVARKWVTEVLRTEALDRDDVVVDARFTVTSGGETTASPALLRLHRSSNGWRLVDVQLLGGQ